NGNKSILLIVLMSLFVILTACQSNNSSNEEESKSSEENSEENEEVKTLEPEVVNVYVRENLKEQFDEVIKNFEENHEDIKLNVKYMKKYDLMKEADIIEQN